MPPRWFRTALFITAFLPLAGAAPLAGQNVPILKGRVAGANDSLPVVDAVVSVPRTAIRALTDSDGRFTIPRPGPGNFPVAILRLGFQPDTVPVGAGQDSIVVYLRPAAVRLEALQVEGEQPVARVRFEELAQLSTVTLSAPELKRVPGMFEADVFRVIQLLPGTIARNDYSTGYNVRGGESDQNLVQVDGIPMFNPSHLAGIFSTFDADAIDHTDFLSGGFPAGYSGRLSSVLDIGLRPGARDRVRASSAISLLSSKLLVEGPLPGNASALFSARRTYLDAVVKAFTDDILPYYFTDLLGKVQLPTGDGDTLAVTGYWGRDDFSLTLIEPDTVDPGVRLAFNWGNRLGGARWWGGLGAARVELRAGYSDFTSTLGLLPDLAVYNNTARLMTAGATAELRPSPAHTLRVGGGVERYDLFYTVELPVLSTVLADADYEPTVLSAFVDEQWSPSRRWLVRPGARLEHIPSARFTGFSPRVAAKFFFTDDAALTASAGRYYQPIHSIRDQELPITIYEVWIGADQYVPVGRSDHLVFGFETWPGRSEQITVEGYRKTFDGLVSPNRGQDLRRRGDEFLPAFGTSWGVDVLLRRHAGRVRGWVAYTFNQARRESDGERYPPAHDRRHTLNIVVETRVPTGATLGARWGYGSSLPYTGFLGEWYHRRYNVTDHVFDEEAREVLGGPRNGERYPHYSRLDLGLRWSFRKLGATWEPYLQVVNLYNRRNVFLYFFDYSGEPATRTGVSQLPIIPTFGLEIRL